jgi:hypothetical protein
MHAARSGLAVALAAGSLALSAGLPQASAVPETPHVASIAVPVIRGADISWPNCPKGLGIPSRRTKGEPLPKKGTTFTIVGLTNGPGFYPNPCIARQLRWVRAHHMQVGAYAMTTYPTRAERANYGGSGPYTGAKHAALRNTAYAEALFNGRIMSRQHLVVPTVWVDVEPYPVAPWTHNQAANRLVVQAVIRGYRRLGYHVGIYTYANGWNQVVGRWSLPTVSTWSTVGGRGKKKALAACTTGPSGGRTLVAQWYDTKRDYDLLCPSAQGNPAALFTGT